MIDNQSIEKTLETFVDAYIRQGFRITSRTTNSAQLVKPKQFSGLLAFILLLLWIVPLIIYLLYYWSKKDETIYIFVRSAQDITIVDESGHERKVANASDVFYEPGGKHTQHLTARGKYYENRGRFVNMDPSKDPGISQEAKIFLGVMIFGIVMMLIITAMFS